MKEIKTAKLRNLNPIFFVEACEGVRISIIGINQGVHGSDKCYGMRKVKIEATFCTNTWPNLKKAALSYTFGSQFRWLINMGLPSSDFISMHVCHIFQHGFEQWPLSSTLCGDSHGPEVTAVHRLFR